MGTYIQRDTDEAQGWISADNENTLSASTGSSTTETVNVPASAASQNCWAFIAPEGEGATDWTTTGYGGQLDVTAAGADLTYAARYTRVSSDGATARNFDGTALASTTSGTGLKPFGTSTWAAGNGDAARATTDRMAIRVPCSNASMMDAEALTLRLNTTDSYVTVPWTVAGAAPEVIPLLVMAPIRR